jgi:hypothetical protein
MLHYQELRLVVLDAAAIAAINLTKVFSHLHVGSFTWVAFHFMLPPSHHHQYGNEPRLLDQYFFIGPQASKPLHHVS